MKVLTSPIAQPDATASTTLTIAGVSELVILRYFETLNEGAFQATGHLFAADGEMQPPFEQAVVGVDAIAAYLQAEAKGFNLLPRQGVVKLLDGDCTEVQVVGKVQTTLFSVNVSWLFVLNPEKKLLLAKIKLLASPQELLSLRS
ncbi:ketosteroid isomerase family protein [Stenomitos frigidus]|uniref:Nuclear transport factor 2 n=1 Tax=Stenomitos frigidus ULC18 TaxID=2107698 RepID=A0A2T1DYB0_9CYAN|nr:ketosteroid isomerase family protein [Stenomitos frigidus]PSB25478.1 nuclear transport factor 2 [Stenomitos frigidus ULC18]